MTTYFYARIDPSIGRADREDHGSATTPGPVHHGGRGPARPSDRDSAAEAQVHGAAAPQPDRHAPSASPAGRSHLRPVADSTPELAPKLTAGPSVRLRALPQPTAGQLATPEGVEQHLAELQMAREAQLDALPATAGNVVAAAHRDTVVWLINQIRTARRRLAEGSYGLCARCGTRIGSDRLNLRPWRTTCTACGPIERHARILPPATGT